MAATTEAVLSVAELRRELRISLEDTNPETAALVEAQRDSAVSAVSEYLAAPLVDTDRDVAPVAPGRRHGAARAVRAGLGAGESALLVNVRCAATRPGRRDPAAGSRPHAAGRVPLPDLAAGRRLAGGARGLSTRARGPPRDRSDTQGAAAGMRARCAGLLRRGPDGDESGRHVRADRTVAADRCSPTGTPVALTRDGGQPPLGMQCHPSMVPWNPARDPAPAPDRPRLADVHTGPVRRSRAAPGGGIPLRHGAQALGYVVRDRRRVLGW